MRLLSTEEKRRSRVISLLVIYILANVLACFFIAYFLFYAHNVFNGIIIPRRFFYSVTRPDQDLTPLYSFSLIIITVELIVWLLILHRFNKWYCHSVLNRKTSFIAWLATLCVGLTVSVLTVQSFWFLIKKL